MLLAEIRGKRVQEARDSEDYLTSAVFGHLRYIPPAEFWPALFGKARSSVEGQPDLGAYLAGQGAAPDQYTALEARFWPRHPDLGEPDLVLRFHAPGKPDLVVVVEVKLWASPGGSGEEGQLHRYLRLLDRLHGLEEPLEQPAVAVLVYLTPRDAREEIAEALGAMPSIDDGCRLFSLQWQDVLDVARSEEDEATGHSQVILGDVAGFLAGRKLEYFRGFGPVDLPDFEISEVVFYEAGRRVDRFTGWHLAPDLGDVEVVRGGWIR